MDIFIKVYDEKSVEFLITPWGYLIGGLLLFLVG